jgi:hypothetical protein
LNRGKQEGEIPPVSKLSDGRALFFADFQPLFHSFYTAN